MLPLVPGAARPGARQRDAAARRRPARRSRAPVGRLLPQPRLARGGALDDLLGPGFAVLTRVAARRPLAALAAALARPCCASATTCRRRPLVPGATAVVVRPDRAVLAVARTGAPGAELLRTRAAALALVGASPVRVTQHLTTGVEAPP